MNWTRNQIISNVIVLGVVGVSFYWLLRPQPMHPVSKAVFVRSESIQNEFCQNCELKLNGQPFSGQRHLIPRKSELEVTGKMQFNPKHIIHPSNAHGLMIIGYRPRGSPETAWTGGAPESEWVGGHAGGNVKFKTEVTIPTGEYDLRAYAIIDIFGMDTPLVEFVAKGEAVVTE